MILQTGYFHICTCHKLHTLQNVSYHVQIGQHVHDQNRYLKTKHDLFLTLTDFSERGEALQFMHIEEQTILSAPPAL